VKIAVVLDSEIRSGGGFNQSVSALKQFVRLMDRKCELTVIATHRKSCESIAQMKIAVDHYSPRLRDKFFPAIFSGLLMMKVAKKLRLKSPFQAMLLRSNIDLVYFLSPSSLAQTLTETNYILTVWDQCHLDWPEFPEVRTDFEFSVRDSYYRQVVPRAILTIADSEALKSKLERTYGVDSERVISMPFAPGFEVGDAMEVKDGDYLFYPAQFWPHKNHNLILEAVGLLRSKGIDQKVVFVGSDQGNRDHLVGRIKALAISDLVSLKGFVSKEEVRSLFAGCKALVMPTFFGPTNIPPLEAWQMGKPVLYSKHLSGDLNGSVVAFDNCDPQSLVSAIESLENRESRARVIANGFSELQRLSKQRATAEQKFENRIELFGRLRRTWGRT
jgi:glycosyltransferase involved in cell wall biosynthesis